MTEQDKPANPEILKDQAFDFERAIADIQQAAEILARPESKQAFQAVQDAVKAVAAVQDAVKAVAVQDAVKAVAVQDAVKAVVASAGDELRTAISQEIERAVQLIREAAKSAELSRK